MSEQLVEPIQALIDQLLPRPRGSGALAELARALRLYPERGGKFLRARITLLSGQAFAAPLRQTQVAAAALEVFQNWVLIHDDIEDGAETRRGGPALHQVYGIPLAINAGDALHGLMWQLLVQNQLPMAALGEFAHLVNTTARGQHMELFWIEKQVFTLAQNDYLAMASAKSAYYTVIAPLRLGAILAGLEPAPALSQAGEQLGVAFQIIDDLLSLEGDPKQTGKDPLADLYEAKRTLILLHFLAEAQPEKAQRAREFLLRPRPGKSEAEARWLLGAFSEVGSLDYARIQAQTMAKLAIEQLAPILEAAPGSHQELLITLNALVERSA